MLRVAGRVEYVAERWQAAVDYYERALASGRRYPPLLVDLAQVRIRLDDWQGARAAADAAISSSRGSPTAFALNVQSQILEHFGDLPAAEAAIAAALLQDPTNAGYHHRLGRIAEQSGDRAIARDQYEECLSIDPTYVESLISLASLTADEGDYVSAKASLAKVRRIQGVRPAVIENVAAKIALADGDLAGARDHIARALDSSRDASNVGLAGRIQLALHDTGEQDLQTTREAIRLIAIELSSLGQPAEANTLRIRAGLDPED